MLFKIAHEWYQVMPTSLFSPSYILANLAYIVVYKALS